MVWRRTTLQQCVFIPAVIGLAFCAVGADTTGVPDSSPLGIRQQRVRRMMEQLDRKLQDLAQKLEESEPEQARLLIEAFQQSQERLIVERMNDIAGLLDRASLSDAGGKQDEVLLELDAILRVLLNRSQDQQRVNEEMQRLEEMRAAVRELLERQREHLRETDRLANKDRTLEELNEQIRTVEELIDQQTALEKRTEQTRADQSERLKDLAEDQEKLQEATEQLAESVHPEEGGDSRTDTPNSARSEASKSASNSGAGQPTQKGSKLCQACLGQASQSQKSATQKLKNSLPQDAQQDERQAIENLKDALEALKEDRDRIARLPKEMLEELAKEQSNTAEDTQQLLDEMQVEGGDKNDSQRQQQRKGQKNVQQAEQSMQQAAEGLRMSDAESAAADQERAVEELKKALNEIEMRLAQLREDTLIDRLARLESRFREMLARQEHVSQETVAVHARQAVGGKLGRADRLKLRKLANEEGALSEEAFQAIDILIEDGTSVVFPRVVTNLQADFERLAELLSEHQTGDYTQALQEEVEVTLQELIDALQRNLKKKKVKGGGGSCDCEPPLLPGSAELKLLRSMQLRVNRRTVVFDKLSGEGKLDDIMQKEANSLTALQEEVAEMTLDLAEK